MNCDEVRDLTGAYVIGGTTEDEARQIEIHVAGCGLHTEITGLAATVMGLAVGVPEIAPPAGLGERISAAVRAEHDATDHVATSIAPVARPLSPRAPSRVSSRTRRFVPWSVAAALAVAVGALVIWNVTLQFDDPGRELVHFFKESDGDWVQIEVTLGESNARVSLGGFDPLPSGRDYQLWAVRDDTAISLGVFDTGEDGVWSGDVDFALERGDRIAITEEVEGGSSAPTTEPLLSTRL